MGDSMTARSGHMVVYPHSTFAPSTSPPAANFRSDPFNHQSSPQLSAPLYVTSPTLERHPSDRPGVMPPSLSVNISDQPNYGRDTRPAPAVVIRRLPRNMGAESLRSMLLFAGDLIDTEFIRSPYPEDQGFSAAVARFQTSTGALEAQQKLHGKPNATKEANMIVEAHGGGSIVGGFERRHTLESPAPRTQTSPASSGGSNGAPTSRSRYGSTFQSGDSVSPPLPSSSSGGNGELPFPENSAHFQNLFSPQSPLANGVDRHHRVSGKSVINDDSADDETGELLKDPVAYAKSGQHPMARRPTNPQVPISRFGNLSLNTGAGGGCAAPTTSNGLTSPRSAAGMQATMSPMSPSNMGGIGPNGAFVPNYPRPQYPPVNPADQNPPCNTLYVGNLPVDTSEDELKSVFSKQRGYKRLCFRTKQNGPMCFVEFEDVSFATKALHELYGHPLHNSVKGGIRLSFSKNPLGVRSGQTSGYGSNAVMSPQAMAPGYGMLNGSTFSAVSGPPPGLGTPAGMMDGGYRSPTGTGMDGMFSAPFGMSPHDFVNQLSPRNYSGGVPPNLGSGAFGRDNRNSNYNDFALGR